MFPFVRLLDSVIPSFSLQYLVFFRTPMILSVQPCFIPYSPISVCNPVLYSVLPNVSLQYLVFFRTPMALSCTTELFPYSHVSDRKTVFNSVLPSIFFF